MAHTLKARQYSLCLIPLLCAGQSRGLMKQDTANLCWTRLITTLPLQLILLNRRDWSRNPIRCKYKTPLPNLYPLFSMANATGNEVLYAVGTTVGATFVVAETTATGGLLKAVTASETVFK